MTVTLLLLLDRFFSSVIFIKLFVKKKIFIIFVHKIPDSKKLITKFFSEKIHMKILLIYVKKISSVKNYYGSLVLWKLPHIPRFYLK